MFYRHHNLKQAIGLLGVVLALLSGVQQGHAFCYLAGCGPSLVLSERTDSLAGACPCSQACGERLTSSLATISLARVDGAIHRPSDSCPCPSTCWCHQSPEPLSLPASAPSSVELLAQSIGLATVLLDCDLGSLHDQATATDAPFETAMLRCAKLCRFLI